MFTENINNALKFALEVDSGNLNINSGTQFRADLMPYGGLKDSGMGKEGPKYAIEEMIPLSSIYSLSIIIISSVMLLFLKNIINKQINVPRG